MLYDLLMIGGPTFAILYQGWRAWDFRRWWRPVQADMIDSDYSEAERLEDNEPLAWLRPHPFTDGRTGRRTRMRVAFADASGHRHEADIRDTVKRGSAASPTMRIYCDTRDTDRVDRFGATGAVGMMIAWGLLLAYVLFRMATSVRPPF